MIVEQLPKIPPLASEPTVWDSLKLHWDSNTRGTQKTGCNAWPGSPENEFCTGSSSQVDTATSQFGQLLLYSLPFLPDFFLFLIEIPTSGGSSQFESQYLRWYFPVFMGTWIKPFGGLAKMENITTFSLGIPPVPVSHLPTWRMRRARSKGDASLPGGSPGAGFSGQIHGLAFWWIWWLNYPKLGVSAIWRYLLEFLEAPVKPV